MIYCINNSYGVFYNFSGTKDYAQIDLGIAVQQFLQAADPDPGSCITAADFFGSGEIIAIRLANSKFSCIFAPY
jgi:hypothetical protein